MEPLLVLVIDLGQDLKGATNKGGSFSGATKRDILLSYILDNIRAVIPYRL